MDVINKNIIKKVSTEEVKEKYDFSTKRRLPVKFFPILESFTFIGRKYLKENDKANYFVCYVLK